MIPQELAKYFIKAKPLNASKNYHAFISYKSNNRRWVLNLYDVLVELGYLVFLDQYVLKPSDKLVSALQKGLIESQAGILIWSGDASHSKWVEDEYNAMIQLSNQDTEFKFIPVRLEQVPLPLFVKIEIFLDFSDYPDGPNGGDLIRLIYAINGKALDRPAILFAASLDEQTKEEELKIKTAIQNNNPKKLVELFENCSLPWKISSAIACLAANGLISLKQYDEAIRIIELMEKEYDRAIRLKQLKALAYARRGNENDLEKAQEIIGILFQKNNLDPETLGIYGRTWFDRFKQSNDINDLKESRRLYEISFLKNPEEYYTGINAASKSILIGTPEDIVKGMKYAQDVQKIVGIHAVDGDYWKTATIAEVFLLQKKYKEAATLYQQAVDMDRFSTGSHESSYKQAKALMEKLETTNEDRNLINKAFTHLGS